MNSLKILGTLPKLLTQPSTEWSIPMSMVNSEVNRSVHWSGHTSLVQMKLTANCLSVWRMLQAWPMRHLFLQRAPLSWAWIRGVISTN